MTIIHKEAIFFSTLYEAKQWSLKNNGKAFTRSPCYEGFTPKKTYNDYDHKERPLYSELLGYGGNITFFRWGDCKIENKQRIIDDLDKYEHTSKDEIDFYAENNNFLAWEDSATGLVWESKNLFKVYKNNKVLNELGYAGRSDWRMPSLIELSTLMRISDYISTTKKYNVWGRIPKILSSNARSHGGDIICYDLNEGKACVNWTKNGTESWANSNFGKDSSDGFAMDNILVCGQLNVSKTTWVNDLVLWASKHNVPNFPIDNKKINSLTQIILSGDSGDNLDVIFPDAFSNLQNLRKIHFHNKYLKEFPKPILKILGLEEIDLGSEIKYIPSEIGNLQKLKMLNLQRNKFKTLPEEITELKNLEMISIATKGLILTQNQKKWIKKLYNEGVNIHHTEEFNQMLGFSVKRS
jgi:hypothetical protein